MADLLPSDWLVGVVGRLDKPTTGALLVTDDGDLDFLLTSPTFHVWKRYLLTVVGEPDAGDPRLQRLRDGVLISGEATEPARCGIVEGVAWPGRDGTRLSQLCLEIREGRFRQVRRMANHVGFKLVRLHRVAIGPVELGDLAEGRWRELDADEVEGLYDAAGGREAPVRRARAALWRRLEAGELDVRDAALVERYFVGLDWRH